MGRGFHGPDPALRTSHETSKSARPTRGTRLHRPLGSDRGVQLPPHLPTAAKALSVVGRARQARVEEIAATIRIGGLALVEARQIKAILHRLEKDGTLTSTSSSRYPTTRRSRISRLCRAWDRETARCCVSALRARPIIFSLWRIRTFSTSPASSGSAKRQQGRQPNVQSSKSYSKAQFQILRVSPCTYASSAMDAVRVETLHPYASGVRSSREMSPRLGRAG